MIGHWVGCLAEVAIKVDICNNLSPQYKDLCKSSTVFIHELLVEPLTNALFFTLLKSMMSRTSDSLSQNSHANPWISLFTGAVASLYLGEVTKLIPNNLKPQTFLDHEPYIEAVLSLPGNLVGETIYENIGYQSNPATMVVLTSLVGYKFYSNLNSQDEQVYDKKIDSHWDNSTCLLSEQPQIEV